MRSKAKINRLPLLTVCPSIYHLLLNNFKHNGSNILSTRVRDKNFMIFNQAKDIEYWAAFQGRLIYLYSLVLLIPEDKLPA